MAHLKNDLFRDLVRMGVFKDNSFYTANGQKISRASNRTEEDRRMKNRVKFGIFIPNKKGVKQVLGKLTRKAS